MSLQQWGFERVRKTLLRFFKHDCVYNRVAW